MQKTKGRPRIQVAPCKFCNKQFKRQEHLQRHERTHTQEKPFSCFCNRIFSRQDLLVRHERRAHPERDSQHPIDANGQLGTQQPPSSTNQTHSTVVQISEDLSSAVGGDEYIQPEDMDQQENSESLASAEPAKNRHDAEHPFHSIFSTGTDNIVTPDFLQNASVDFEFFSNDLDTTQAFLQSSYLGSDYQFSGQMDSMYDHGHITNTSTIPHGDSETGPNVNEYRGNRTLASPSLSAQRPESRKDECGVISARDLNVSHQSSLSTPWIVSAQSYETLCQELAQCRRPLPKDFVLPGRQTLSRYLEGYFRSFHPHLPFLNVSTASLDSMSLRLVLSLAAVGAFYRFEHPQGYNLYLIARGIIEDHLENDRRQRLSPLIAKYPAYAEIPTPYPPTDVRTDPSDHDLPDVEIDLETIQALLVLIQLTIWVDRPAFSEGFSMTGWLAAPVRSALSLLTRSASPNGWRDWCRQEELRRTVYCVYITSNLIMVCYNLPPLITNMDLDLSLPCCVAEWEAQNEASWNLVKRRGTLQHLSFRQCFLRVLKGQRLEENIAVTAFGNYVLIHGLLQQLYYERRSSHTLLSEAASLSDATVDCYKKALASWQSSWENTRESTLDPLSPHGPLGYNSTAIFRLVHVRLSVDLAQRQMFDCRDSRILARGFFNEGDAVAMRIPHVENAVLQCIHVLRNTIRAGVAFVARTRTAHWSVQHAISTFECAMLLTRWLQSIAVHVETFGLGSLKNDEKVLLKMLAEVIEETHLAESLRGENEPYRRIYQLGTSAIELWAESCKSVHVFGIVHVIGNTLSYVARKLHDTAATNSGS